MSAAEGVRALLRAAGPISGSLPPPDRLSELEKVISAGRALQSVRTCIKDAESRHFRIMESLRAQERDALALYRDSCALAGFKETP